MSESVQSPPDNTDAVLGGLINLMRKANPQQKLAMARALGVTPTHKAPKRDRNQEARDFVRSYGAVTHSRGFQPKVPEGVAALDEQFAGAASEMWLQGWNEGRYLDVDTVNMALEQGLAAAPMTEILDGESLAEMLK